MPWNEPCLPSIEAECDKCGATEDIGPYNSPSGHWIYPQPGERGSMGWDHGSYGLMCPDCLANDDGKGSDSEEEPEE